MNTTSNPSLFQACDFCQTKGILGKTITDREGWYFCKPCVEEIDRELEKRKAERESAQRNALTA
jgi:hypothetical protein